MPRQLTSMLFAVRSRAPLSQRAPGVIGASLRAQAAFCLCAGIRMRLSRCRPVVAEPISLSEQGSCAGVQPTTGSLCDTGVVCVSLLLLLWLWSRVLSCGRASFLL